MSKEKTVYVYEDLDHDEIEVFNDLRKAQQHAEKQWPDEEQENSWEQCRDGVWNWFDYVFIHRKVVKK